MYVSLGNTITAGSFYLTTVSGGLAKDPVVADAFSVDVVSTLAATAVDSESGVIATKGPQFAAIIAKETDGVIERTARLAFNSPEGVTAWQSYELLFLMT